jgi:hypothetical protein
VKLLIRQAGAISLGAVNAVSVSGAGAVGATGAPASSGSGATPRCGCNRLASACHAAPSSCGGRVPFSQARGDSCPPHTSQFSGVLVLCRKERLIP